MDFSGFGIQTSEFEDYPSDREGVSDGEQGSEGGYEYEV